MHVRSFKMRTLALALILLTLAGATFAQAPAAPPSPANTPANTNDPFSMDLDSLANTKVTTASKFSEQISSAPSVISVVTKDELRRFGGATLIEILSRVAGINQSTGFFEDRSILAVRGDQTQSNGGHVLILINGRPVRESLGGGVSSDILQSFPVAVLERIEVIKGPGSVLYGSDAFSGVINLITLKPDGNSFYASGSRGPSGEATGSEQILLSAGGLSIVESAQYQQTPQSQVLHSALVTNVVNDSADGLVSQVAPARTEGAGAYLGLNYHGLSFMSSYTGLEAPSFLGGVVGNVRSKRGFADLGYSLKVSPKWEMTINETFNRNILDAPDFPNIHRDSYEALSEWTNFITFSDNDRLTLGSLYAHVSGTEFQTGVAQPAVDLKASRNEEGFYAQYEHKLTDDLKLIAGVQANKIGGIRLAAVPRGGVLWNPADHLTFKALYGISFHAPSLLETSVHNTELQGNPQLSHEKVGTLDLQLGYTTDRLEASVDYFHSRLADLIVPDLTRAGLKFGNLDPSGSIQGFDSESKYYLMGDWFALGSVLYQLGTGSYAGDTLVNAIPRLSAKAGISYLSRNGLQASLFDGYQGHIPGYGTSLNPKPDAFQSMAAHVRWDLSKLRKGNHPNGVALFVHADNLINRQIWLPSVGSSGLDTIPISFGRTILFGVEVWRKAE